MKQPTKKKFWFKLFDGIYQNDVSSGIDCRSICQALCCPKANPSSEQIGKFVIFLPFEFEYVTSVQKKIVEKSNFNWEEIIMSDGTKVSIPWTESCPFLVGNSCGIYSARPIDCRSFPLIPFNEKNTLLFRIHSSCPGNKSVSKPFQTHVSNIWHKVNENLPLSWWELLERVRSMSSQTTK